MAALVDAFFTTLLTMLALACLNCLAVNPDKAAKTFIEIVLEKQNDTCIVTGPFRAIPRVQYIRTRLGISPEAFLVPDVMIWDPMLYFPNLPLFCPSCSEQGTQEYVRPIRWKDGRTTHDQPRLLYGLRNDVLLVGRVYHCNNKHQILSHDPGVLSQVRQNFVIPFVLFHRAGVTRELFQFFISHIRTGMSIADVQVLWQQTLFDEYGLRKMCYLVEQREQVVEFPTFSPKGRRVAEKIATVCYIHEYSENEHLYSRRMCQMTASSLSADHTFKVPANIGFWVKKKWIKLFDSLFIVMSEKGLVLSWKLCKGTGFHGIEDLLHRLKKRLSDQGCDIHHFYIDNCCHWRTKLNSVFPDCLIKLDPFHAIQRFTSRIPKKGTKGSPLQRLRSQVITDFKLILREPTDCGRERTMPTASREYMEKNIDSFLKQWEGVEFEGTKLIPQSAIHEIQKLLIHIKKGCLSDISPSHGTNRNEGMHRILNKTLKKSRIGVQFALALLGVFFYSWNEKKMSPAKKRRQIQVIRPIQSHFDMMENLTHERYSESFGIVDYSAFSEPDAVANCASSVEDLQESSAVELVSQCNAFLNDDTLPSSSDEDEYCDAEHSLSQPPPAPAALCESLRNTVINNSKSMNDLCMSLQSTGHFEKFHPKIAMFAKSSLSLLTSHLQSNKETSGLDSVLANYNLRRIPIPPNGNCFFLTIAHALSNGIMLNQSASNEMLSHLATLGITKNSGSSIISTKLRKIVVDEWMAHPDEYKPFLSCMQAVEIEAKLFLNDGHFASELGNSMPLAMANALKLPMVIFTQMENMPVLPISPRVCIQCMPIYVAFDLSGSGHYDAVAPITTANSNQESEILSSNGMQDELDKSTCCRCGQGAKKKAEHIITSCDKFKSRCKCFQGVKGCSDKCQCLGCENPYGKRIQQEQKSHHTAGTRKRRAHGMTTECKSGEQFMLKRPCAVSIGRWTFLEELVLVQLCQSQFVGDDIDMAGIHIQYLSLVDGVDIHSKTLEQIMKKVVSYLNDNEVFKTLFKEQIRLNWFE